MSVCPCVCVSVSVIRQMKNNWWSKISAEMQNAYNRKDSKSLYKLVRQVFAPERSTVAPMRSKDGRVLIKDAEGTLARWTEHFKDLFLNPLEVDEAVINGLSQSEIIAEMMANPTLEEIKKTIKQVNTGKAPGLDGIPVELLRFGGDELAAAIQSVILRVWEGIPVPHDRIDAILVSLFVVLACLRQLEGCLPNCCSFGWKLGSALISFQKQCGFRTGRGTMDMIFSAHQLQEKCMEQRVPIYQVFLDLTKAFDPVNRSALWIILEKLGYPSGFVDCLASIR